MQKTKININTDKKFLFDKKALKDLIHQIIALTNKKFKTLELTFVNDEKLLELNNKFLSHNYYTDILTFAYVPVEPYETEILISYERALQNSLKYKTSFEDEILRLIAHGILHTIGFDDRTKSQKVKMRKLENNLINPLKAKRFIKKMYWSSNG